MDVMLLWKIAYYGLILMVAAVIPIIIGYVLSTRAGREALWMGIMNLLRSPLRTILTMIGVVIGVGAVVAVVSMGDGAREMVVQEVAQAGGLSVIEVYRDEWDQQGGSTITSRTRTRRWGRWGRNRAEPLNIRDYRNLRMYLTDVEAICAEADFGRGVIFQYGESQKDSGLFGTTPGFQEVYNWRVERGRFFTEEEFEQGAKVVILGAQIAEDLFGTEDPLGKEIRGQRAWGRNQEAVRYTVIGILARKGASASTEGWDDRVYLPLTTFQERVAGDDEVERIRIKALTVEDVPYVIEQAKRIIRREHPDPEAYTFWTATEEIATAERLGTIMKLLMGVIATIALVVAGIGIMNIMLVSVAERTREIGLRKALGAKRRDILFQFLIETAVLTIIGGGLGTTLGVLMGESVAVALNRLVLQGSQWPAVISLEAVGRGGQRGLPDRRAGPASIRPTARPKLTPVEALRVE
ncbi:MAG: ABC transporter permease [Candidatus Poribacteria bacterium]|nr:MAG: ABC transporter permease [Candidatus Poribacteria bacterium]